MVTHTVERGPSQHGGAASVGGLVRVTRPAGHTHRGLWGRNQRGTSSSPSFPLLGPPEAPALMRSPASLGLTRSCRCCVLPIRPRYAMVLRMTDTEDEGRVATPLRLLSSLRARVDEYARRRGISLNAAASILLDEGLLAEERRRGPTEDAPPRKAKQ